MIEASHIRGMVRSDSLRADVAAEDGSTGRVDAQEPGYRAEPAESAAGLKREDEAVPALGSSADASAAPDGERRSEPRQIAGVMGRLRLPASELDCEIVDLSMSGMKIVTEDAVVSIGEQVAVAIPAFPRLIGIVRWTADGVIGIQFQRPLAAGIIEKMGELRRRVRGPRAGRVKLELASVVYFDGARQKVVVDNISADGLSMTTCSPVLRGQRKLIRDGQALMIQFPDLLPIGGHVRWTCGARCGVAFSKLLPLPFAEETARLGEPNPAWLDVGLAHADFAAN